MEMMRENFRANFTLASLIFYSCFAYSILLREYVGKPLHRRRELCGNFMPSNTQHVCVCVFVYYKSVRFVRDSSLKYSYSNLMYTKLYSFWIISSSNVTENHLDASLTNCINRHTCAYCGIWNRILILEENVWSIRRRMTHFSLVCFRSLFAIPLLFNLFQSVAPDAISYFRSVNFLPSRHYGRKW